MDGKISPGHWRKATEIYGEALELPADARDGWLKAACGTDVTLLATVRAMLQKHNELNSFLEVDGSRSSASLEEPETILPTNFIVGGRYKITRLLGSGGMGEVYAAEDIENADTVAIKVLRTELIRLPINLARFRREFVLARRIRHTNVCAMHDFIQADGPSGPLHICVMELLGGTTLAAFLKDSSTISYKLALEIARQMADALDAAHAAGVIHRDFKPTNVMVAAQTPTRVTIMDFGIARSMNPVNTTSRLALTATGAQPGTHGYMAPELLSGETATAAADVYSYGVVLRAIALRAGFVNAWSSVVSRCTAIEPRRRFLSAGAAYRALPKRRLSRRLVVATVTAGMATAGAGLTWHAYRGQQRLEDIRVVVATFANTTADGTLDGTSELLRLQLNQSPQLHILNWDEVAQLRKQVGVLTPNLSPAEWQLIAWRGNAQLLVTGSITLLGTGYGVTVQLESRGNAPGNPVGLRTYSISARNKALLTSSISELCTWIRQQAGESKESVARFDRMPEDVSTPSWEALSSYSRAEQALARYAYGDALTFLDQALKEDPLFTLAATRRGDVLMGQQQHRAGLTQWRDALRMLEKRSLTRREEVYVRGMYAFDSGDLTEAQKYFHTWALEFPNDWRGYFYQTVPLILSEHAAEAITNLRRVLELNPGYNRTWAQIANCQIALGNWKGAEEAIGSIAMSKDMASARFKKGSLHFAKREWEAARAVFREMQKDYQLQESDTQHARGVLYEGMLAMELRRYDEAFACVKADIIASLPSGQDTYRAYFYLLGAFAAWKMGDRTNCRNSIDKALDIELGPHVLALTGTLLARLGDPIAAASKQKLAAESAFMKSYAIAAETIAGEMALAAGKRTAAEHHFRTLSNLLPRVAFRHRLAALEPERERLESYRKMTSFSFLVFLDPMKQEPGALGDVLHELRRL